jgi:hypothetical protein
MTTLLECIYNSITTKPVLMEITDSDNLRHYQILLMLVRTLEQEIAYLKSEIEFLRSKID